MKWRAPLVNHTIERSTTIAQSPDALTALYRANTRENAHTIIIDKGYLYTLEGEYEAALIIIATRIPVKIHDILKTATREIVLLPGASCTYIQQIAEKCYTQTTLIHAEQNSSLSMFCIGSYKHDASQSITVNMHASGASVDVRVAYKVYGAAHVALETTQRHRAPHTTSTLEVRKIVDDTASAAYHGLVHIDAVAAHSVASQQDRTLLGSSMARATSAPALEVLTHDVQCAHGSALGMLDAEQQWYLHTRGISPKNADTMLRAAFFAEMLQPIAKFGIYTDILKILGVGSTR
jgi:Fe-S cluster assembly scaffold protein SufB